MSQLRRHSLLESCCSTATGFALSLLAGFYIYPLFGFPVTVGENFGITLCFTVISIGRQYVWRRVFNWWQHRECL